MPYVFAADDPAQGSLDEEASRVRQRGGREPTPPGTRPAWKLTDRDETEPPTGLVLGGRYEIVRFLDSGGTARIYLAEDLTTGDLVVVKVLRSRAAANPVLKGRFLVGAAAAMRVDHPQVIRVLKVEEPEGQVPYAVMEALMGQSLADFQKNVEIAGTDFALQVMHWVALGLAAVHAQGIVHRDIKPENLFLLGPHEAPCGLKVLDFELAKLPSADESLGANMCVGTGQYMAPEQILNDEVDGRADLYALGIVMFRLLTGQLPFDLRLSADLLRHQLLSPIPPVSWLNEGVDLRVEAIVHKLLRKQPEERYQSAEELSEDIERVRGERAGPVSAFRPMPKLDRYRARSEQAREAARLLRVQLDEAGATCWSSS